MWHIFYKTDSRAWLLTEVSSVIQENKGFLEALTEKFHVSNTCIIVYQVICKIETFIVKQLRKKVSTKLNWFFFSIRNCTFLCTLKRCEFHHSQLHIQSQQNNHPESSLRTCEIIRGLSDLLFSQQFFSVPLSHNGWRIFRHRYISISTCVVFSPSYYLVLCM